MVYSDGPQLRAYDRDSGDQWVAADDASSSPDSPVLSPDGRFRAFIAVALVSNVPHVPFAGSTVTAERAIWSRDVVRAIGVESISAARQCRLEGCATASPAEVEPRRIQGRHQRQVHRLVAVRQHLKRRRLEKGG